MQVSNNMWKHTHQTSHEGQNAIDMGSIESYENIFEEYGQAYDLEKEECIAWRQILSP